MRRLGAKKRAGAAIQEPDPPADAAAASEPTDAGESAESAEADEPVESAEAAGSAEAVGPSEAAEPAELQRADTDRTVHGYLDGVSRGKVVGWCCRPWDPGTRLGVEVLIDGKSVAHGTADQLREAVAKAGFGDGRYGFTVPLSRELDDGRTHRVRVRADGTFLKASPSFTGSSDPDRKGPWVRTRFVPARERPAGRPPDEATDRATGSNARQQQGAELRGYVDGVVGDAIVGWVVDEAQTRRRLDVEAYLDGVLIGHMTANRVRKDLGRKGYGDRHGFRFKLPAALEEGEYTVEVRTVPDAWRVPLVSDNVVLDEDRRPIPGVTLKEALVGERIHATEALLGQDGWLFEWPGASVFHILRGRQAMPATVFERQRTRLLERLRLTREAGAVLVEAVIPAKLAVYREFLPLGLDVEDARRPADELTAAFRDENGLDLLDLTAALRQAKRHGAVFTSTGRDLTSLGGFSAYRAVAKELAKSLPQIEPLTMELLELGELEPVADTLADLPRVVWIGSRVLAAGRGADDEEQEGQPRLKRERLSAEYAIVPDELVAYAGTKASMLRRTEPDRRADALVIEDGAASGLTPFLAEHFERTLIVGPDAELAPLLDAFSPEAVIEIATERSVLLM